MSEYEEAAVTTSGPAPGVEVRNPLVQSLHTIQGRFARDLQNYLQGIFRYTEKIFNREEFREITEHDYREFNRRIGRIERSLIGHYEIYDFDLLKGDFLHQVEFWKNHSKRLAGLSFEVYNYWANNAVQPEDTYYLLNTNVHEKLDLISRYAKYDPSEENLAKYIATLFSNLQFVEHAHEQGIVRSPCDTASNAMSAKVIESDRVQLPSSAPALWKAAKLPTDTPPQFIKRVYGEWLGKGLDRPTVRRLDPSLGQALDNWLRKNDMPPDVDLPKAKERNAREIEQLRAASGTGDIKDVLGSFTLREARRIDANIRRHELMKK